MVDGKSVLLAIGYLGALSWGIFEWQRPTSLPSTPARQIATELPEMTLPTTSFGDIETFDEMVQRPPFVSTRRPPSAQGADVQDKQSTPGKSADLTDMRLSAVMIDGDRLTALVENADGTTKRLQVGGHLADWEVQEIQDDQIVLVGDGRRQTLMVHKFDAPPVARKIRRTRQVPNRRAPGRPMPTQADPDSAQTQARQPRAPGQSVPIQAGPDSERTQPRQPQGPSKEVSQ
jgi:hypothetical protein